MLLVGATSSCLDKLPESAIPEGEAMQTFEDAEQILTGIYAGLKSSSLFSGTLTVMPDIQADLAYAVEDFSNTYGPAWLWNILSTDTDVESVYAGLYAIISRCNFFLERIGQVKQQETDVDNLTYLDFYTGEVYTIRPSATRNSSSASARPTIPIRPRTNSVSCCARSTPSPSP